MDDILNSFAAKGVGTVLRKAAEASAPCTGSKRAARLLTGLQAIEPKKKKMKAGPGSSPSTPFPAGTSKLASIPEDEGLATTGGASPTAEDSVQDKPDKGPLDDSGKPREVIAPHGRDVPRGSSASLNNAGQVPPGLGQKGQRPQSFEDLEQQQQMQFVLGQPGAQQRQQPVRSRRPHKRQRQRPHQTQQHQQRHLQQLQQQQQSAWQALQPEDQHGTQQLAEQLAEHPRLDQQVQGMTPQEQQEQEHQQAHQQQQFQELGKQQKRQQQQQQQQQQQVLGQQQEQHQQQQQQPQQRPLRQAPESIPQTFALSELEELRKVAASQVYTPNNDPPWSVQNLLQAAIGSKSHVSIMLMRRSTLSAGKTLVPCMLGLQVLSRLGGGAFGIVYLCRGFVRNARGSLMPIGMVVVKAPKHAEVTRGVSVVTPGVLKQSWPDWQGALEGQHCINVAGAHAVGMYAAVVQVPESGADWHGSASSLADETLAAAVERAKAKLGEEALQSIMAAAPADSFEQELVLTFPIVVMPEAVCDLHKLVDDKPLYGDGGIDALPTTLVTRHVLVGVNHLHQANITHRDLKPTNILVRPNSRMYAGRLPKEVDASELLMFTSEYMVGDFGLSHAEDGEQQHSMQSQCGNTGFSAPEVWKGEPYDNTCDSWSIGMHMACLLTGSLNGMQVDFSVSDLLELIKRAVDACAKYPELQQEVEGFLLATLQMDPGLRINTQRLLQTPLMKRAQALQEQLLDPVQRDKVIDDFIAGCTDAAKQLAYSASWEQLRQRLTKPEQQPEPEPQKSTEQKPAEQQEPAEQQPQQQQEPAEQQEPQQQQTPQQQEAQQQPQPVVLRQLTVSIAVFQDCF